MQEPTKIITCPVCGQEFLPSEIFIPNSFFGNPGEVIKNDLGKIEFFLGKDMDLTEEYTCEHCGTHFAVKANLDFEVTTITAKDVEDDYVTTFEKPKKLKLEEVELFDD